MKKVAAFAALSAGLTAVALRGSRRGDVTFREILRGLTIGADPEDLLQRIAERARASPTPRQYFRGAPTVGPGRRDSCGVVLTRRRSPALLSNATETARTP